MKQFLNLIPVFLFIGSLAAKATIQNEYASLTYVGEIPTERSTPNISASNRQIVAPELIVQIQSGLNYLTETCSGVFDQVVVRIPQASTDTLRFQFTIAGTAQVGTDYTLTAPAVIVFPPGTTQVALPLIPLSDNLSEGTETIELTISSALGTNPLTFNTVSIALKDNVEVIAAPSDTIFVCKGGNVQLQASGAVSYSWQPTSGITNPFVSNPIVNLTTDALFQVTGTLGLCVDTDSVFLKIVNATIDILPNTPIRSCFGATDPIQLFSSNNVGDAGLLWSPSFGLSDPNIPNPKVLPRQTTLYTATVNSNNCPASDTILVIVDTVLMPVITTLDTTVCQDNPVVLASKLIGATTYVWSPSFGLSDPNISNPVATPPFSTTYVLVGTSASGTCTSTATVRINVTPADINIAGPDTNYVCLGNKVGLKAVMNPVGTATGWAPQALVTFVSADSVTVDTDESLWVYVSYGINGCVAVDSVYIQVDSIPALNDITASPVKPYYCPGDTVYLISATYEPAQFPDMTFNWPAVNGEQTPDSLWNMVLSVDSGVWIYKRYTTNNACVDTSTVQILVETPTEFTISGDNQICRGESTQLLVTSNPAGASVEWKDPVDGLSCTNCTNPIAMPQFTRTYIVSGKDEKCPVNASFTVNVSQAPPITWPATEVCANSSIKLNSANFPNTTYNWSGPGITNPGEQQPVVTINGPVTYSVTVTDQFGCSNVETKSFTVLSATINAGVGKLVCLGTSAELTATTTGTQGVVTWTPGAGIGLTYNTPSNQGAQNLYTAVLTYGGALNCTATDTVTVSTIDPGVTLSGDGLLCLGETSQLLAVSTVPGTTFVWGPAGSLSCTACPNPNATPTQTTDYNVKYTNSICSGDFQYRVEVSNVTAIAWPDSLVCPGNSINLNNVGAASGHTYSWNGPGITNVNAATQVVNFTGNTATYRVTVTNNDGCTKVETRNFRRDVVTFSAGPNINVCNGGTAAPQVTITPAISNPDLDWDPPLKNITAVTTLTGTLKYGNGCIATDQVVVTPYAQVDIDTSILINDSAKAAVYCYGTIFSFKAKTSPTAAVVTWYANNVLVGTGNPAEFFVPLDKGVAMADVKIKAVATASTGCADTTEITMNVKRCYDVPNAFTPNGDVDNETFGLVNDKNASAASAIKLDKFVIFNRWGQQIWEATAAQQRWDGKVDGSDAPVDTYLYHMSIQFPDGTTETRTGEVTLLR
jgi:gliding motility-associated-like protein